MKLKGFTINQEILTIQDDLASRLGLLRFLFSLNLLIAIMKLINGLLNGFSFLDYAVVIATGIPAIVFFLYFSKKETAKSTLNLDVISHVEERKRLFRKQYILKLANGKCRQLPNVTTNQQFHELQEALEIAKTTIDDGTLPSIKISQRA